MCAHTNGKVSHSLLNYINTTKCAYITRTTEKIFQLYLILPSMFAKNHSTIQMFIIEYTVYLTLPNLRARNHGCMYLCTLYTYRNICPHIHGSIVVQFKLMLFKTQWVKKANDRDEITLYYFVSNDQTMRFTNSFFSC